MVAEKINAYITEKGIKQSYVAEKAGISLQEMNDYMKGRRRLRADTFFKICRALNESSEIFAPD